MKSPIIPPTPGMPGIYDTKDKCWIGNEHGPLCYEDKVMAQMAATLMNERCCTTTRFRAAPLPEGANQFKDEFTPPLSAEEAWENIRKHNHEN